MTALIPIRDDNPYRRFPLLTVLMIAANVYVFLATARGLLAGPSVETVYRYGAVPCDLLDRCAGLPPPALAVLGSRSSLVSIFTGMFVHADVLHLGFNMLFLWIFGNNVEDVLGRVRFVLFYFVCGIFAAFTHVVFNPGSLVPMIGASGAISGVLAAYLVLFPGATVHSILPIGFIPFPVRTPAWVILGMWFVVQIFGGLAGLGYQQDGGVAFFAHVGGFVAGLVLIFVFRPRGRRKGALDHVA